MDAAVLGTIAKSTLLDFGRVVAQHLARNAVRVLLTDSHCVRPMGMRMRRLKHDGERKLPLKVSVNAWLEYMSSKFPIRETVTTKYTNPTPKWMNI